MGEGFDIGCVAGAEVVGDGEVPDGVLVEAEFEFDEDGRAVAFTVLSKGDSWKICEKVYEPSWLV